jgi:hypothetical protein
VQRVLAVLCRQQNDQRVQEVRGEFIDNGNSYNKIIGTETIEKPVPYNNVERAPQTEPGVSVVKHRGFKDEDLKDEGASAGKSPT